MFQLQRTLIAIFLLGACLLPARADSGHSGGHGEGQSPSAAGVPADKKKPARVVNIAMRETDDGKMLFTPNAIEVREGESIRFVVRNSGKIDHELVIGTESEIQEHAEQMKKFPEMEHADPNTIRLKPGKAGDIYWRFTKSGTFTLACLIPGHIESGMIGKAVVK